MSEITMPTAFHFDVSFADDAGIVYSCQEVSGLGVGHDAEPIAEGGENRFTHRLPKVVKHTTLKLKRGLTGQNSPLITWCKAALEGSFTTPIQPQKLVLSLVNKQGTPVAAWQISNAYPVKWSVGGIDAMKNELAVESIELAYATIDKIS